MINYLKGCQKSTPIGMLPEIISHNNLAISDEFNWIFDSSLNRLTKSVYVPSGSVKSHFGEFVNLSCEYLTIKNPDSLVPTLQNAVDKIIATDISVHNTLNGRFVNSNVEEYSKLYMHDADSIGCYLDGSIVNLPTFVNTKMQGLQKALDTDTINNNINIDNVNNKINAKGYKFVETNTYSQFVIASTTNSGIGDKSVLEGYETYTDASYSHVEGSYNTIKNTGIYSHAEGYDCTVEGEAAHAEGRRAIAKGNYSHAEGNCTASFGRYTHAEGTGLSVKLAKNYSANSKTFEIYADDIDKLQIDKIVTCDHEKYLYSFITKIEISAENGNIIVTTDMPICNYDISIGRSIVVYNTAKGECSHVEGINNLAAGVYSHAEGRYTNAYGYCSHTEGALSITDTSFYYQHVEGFKTYAKGIAGHAEGNDTSAIGHYSHAEGLQTIADAQSAHAEGYGTTASAANSHVEGYRTTASEQCAHAEGSSTTASGAASHAEGGATSASGNYSHTEGHKTIANASNSHAEGYQTTASGGASHTEGSLTEARFDAAHAEGYGTVANTYAQHVEGSFNVIDEEQKYLHIIGNGYDSSNRSNAMTVDKQGNMMIKGNLEFELHVLDTSKGELFIVNDLNSLFEYIKQLEERVGYLESQSVESLQEINEALDNVMNNNIHPKQ